MLGVRQGRRKVVGQEERNEIGVRNSNSYCKVCTTVVFTANTMRIR